MTKKEAEEMARLRATLLLARDFAQSMYSIFANPNFTDRYGDADRCTRMIERIDKVVKP